MNLDKFNELNWQRAQLWHKDKAWSLSDWMTATLGELGEAANVVKKLNRIRDGLAGNKEGVTEQTLRADLADEIADTFIYLSLFATAANINLSEAVVSKYNRTSQRLGMPLI